MVSAKFLVPATLLWVFVLMPYASALSVNLTMPDDGNSSSTGNIIFGCNSTDENLTNLTLFLWDSDNATYYTNTTNVTGTFNDTNWTVNSIPPGNYKWNCMAYDNDSNSAWAAANRTLHVNLFNFLESSSENEFTESVALGDVDNDGDLDYISGNYGQPNRIYKNDGSGHFTLFESSADSYGTTTIAMADLDNDGDLDYISGNYGQPNNIYINDGTGHFSFGGNSSATGNEDTKEIVISDFNTDGCLDYASANQGGNGEAELQIYLNNCSANFTNSQNISLGNSIFYTVASGDVNNDHLPDLVAGGIPSQQTKVYLNNGTGFVENTTLGNSLYTQDISLFDVDNDADLDIIEAPDRNFQNISIFFNNAGSFSTAQRTEFGETNISTAVAIGDFNNDGFGDVIIGNDGQNTVYINDGTGRFSDSLFYENSQISAQTKSVSSGDLDNDGDLDYIAGNYGTNSVYLNRINNNNYVNVYVEGTSSNVSTDAVGTSVIASDMSGTFNGFRKVTAADSSQDGSIQLHFGLPTGSTYTINASFITGKVVSCTVQPPKSFIMYENGSSTGGVPCEVIDFPPAIVSMSPADGNVTTSMDVNFTCNVTDDNRLTGLTLYVWNSTNDLYRAAASPISGTSNSSSWLVQGMAPDTYRWNCIACDNASQCVGESSNYSLNVLIHNRLRVKIVINNTNGSVYVPGHGVDSSDNVHYQYSNPPHFYLASYADNIMYALVFEGRIPRLLEAESDADSHSLSIEQDLDNSRALLAFTSGDWTAIRDRMPLIESGTFLAQTLPSFSFGIGRKYETAVALFYDSIDLRGILKMGRGQHKITVENNASAAGKMLEIKEM